MANLYTVTSSTPGTTAEDLGGADLTNTAPEALAASADAGASDEAARADHVHPLPSAADVGATTQAYVDGQISLVTGGVSAKPNIQAGTTSAIGNLASVTLASHFSGYTPVADDRVLVKDQSAPAQNGWYVVGAVTMGVAALTRIADANASSEFYGVTTCLIARGSLAGKQYKTAQATSFVLGTDAITFTEIPATPLSDATPQPNGTAAAGTGTAAARDDHVHAGETRGFGTLASRPASPAVGDTYAVTSGDATGDRYTCFVASAWTLTGFVHRRADETPYHWWKLDDASGGAVDSGSAGTNLSEAGSAGGLAYNAPLPVGRGARFSGSSGVTRFQGAKDAGMAITTAATIAVWVRLESVSGTQALVCCETNQGSNSQPYNTLAISVVAGALRAWCTTTSQTGSGQSVSGGTVGVGADHLVGVTFGASTLTVWLDGVAVATLSTNGGTLYTAGSNQRWTIGDLTGPGERLAGRVSDARVYDTAKAAAWWQETYERGVGAYRGQ